MQRREKLEAFLIKKDIKPSELARLLGKSRGYIGNILNGNQGFGLDFVLAITAVFPEIDLNWWLKDDNADVSTSYESIVSEPREKYSKKDTCKECDNKDKIINRYEKLCDSQEKTIQRLEAELLSLMGKNKKTG